jgi:hypothetical protein
MTEAHVNVVAKRMYDTRSPSAKRRVGRWNPGRSPYGVRAGRVLTPAALLPTGLTLNVEKREGGR